MLQTDFNVCGYERQRALLREYSLAAGMAVQESWAAPTRSVAQLPVMFSLPQEFESLAAGLVGREIGRYRMFHYHAHARGETLFPPRPPRGAAAVLAFAERERAEAQAAADADHKLATYACSCHACRMRRLSRGLPAMRKEPEPEPPGSPSSTGQPGGAAAEGGEAGRAAPHELGGAGEPGEPSEGSCEGAVGAGAAQEAHAAASGSSAELEDGAAEPNGAPERDPGTAPGAGTAEDGPGLPGEVRPGLQTCVQSCRLVQGRSREPLPTVLRGLVLCSSNLSYYRR